MKKASLHIFMIALVFIMCAIIFFGPGASKTSEEAPADGMDYLCFLNNPRIGICGIMQEGCRCFVACSMAVAAVMIWRRDTGND
jgi:hypothetical protein